MPQKTPFSELYGKVFGRLTILEDLGNPKGIRRVLAKCECGSLKEYAVGHLKGRKIVSCGCKIREETTKRNTTHGLYSHPLNTVWKGMKDRCYYEGNVGHEYYGGKGIKMCDEWKDSFENFYNWAINNGYKKGLVIDRKFNDKDYCPENCRFITYLQSARNMTSNRNIEMNGVTHCVTEWCELYGIDRYIVSDRINKLGWDLEKALTTKIQIKKHVN